MPACDECDYTWRGPTVVLTNVGCAEERSAWESRTALVAVTAHPGRSRNPKAQSSVCHAVRERTTLPLVALREEAAAPAQPELRQMVLASS